MLIASPNDWPTTTQPSGPTLSWPMSFISAFSLLNASDFHDNVHGGYPQQGKNVWTRERDISCTQLAAASFLGAPWMLAMQYESTRDGLEKEFNCTTELMAKHPSQIGLVAEDTGKGVAL